MTLTLFPTLTLPVRDFLSFTLRALVGLVLGSAAVSKLFSIYQFRSITLGMWSILDPFASLIVFLELSVALLLVTGAWSRITLNITIGLFMLFCGLLVFMAVNGASSCGCLGEHEVNPLIMLAVDLAVLVILFFVRCIHRHVLRKNPAFGPIGLAISAAICGAVAIYHPTPERVNAVAGDISTIESPLPIDAVARGNWCIVLYRTNCSHCGEVMDDWIDQSLIDREVNGRQWIFIEVGDSHGSGLVNFSKHAVLHAAHEMPRVRTPLVLYSKDGMIVREFGSPSELIKHAELEP